jgi:uncharacterized UBP type Zn finger protein
MKLNKYTKVILFLILTFTILYLFFLIYNSSNEPNKKNLESESKVKMINKNKKVNMLNLAESRYIGYPNSKKAYVFCYINSALQLLRTLFSNINYPLNDTVAKFIQLYSNDKNRYLEIGKILKLIVPSENERISLFYNKMSNNNIIFRQSDSYEFLEKILNYTIDKNKDLLNFISITSSDRESTDTKNQYIIFTIGNLLNTFGENIKKNNISLNEIINDAVSKPYFSSSDYLSKFSDYLIVHLDMMDDNYKKVLIDIKLNDIVSFETVFGKKYEYKPVSIICHKGEKLESGHYVNYSLRPINKENTKFEWYLYDDNRVVKLKEDISINSSKNGYQPYIILLKRIN